MCNYASIGINYFEMPLQWAEEISTVIIICFDTEFKLSVDILSINQYRFLGHELIEMSVPSELNRSPYPF